jgi:hypothetical protein
VSGPDIAHIWVALQRDARRIVAAYQDGASIGQLSLHYGCSQTPLRELLATEGVVFRAKRKRSMAETREGLEAIRRHLGRPRARR